MRLPATQYVQDDEDLKYLADLNNDYPDMPTLPEGGAAPKVDDVVEAPPAPAQEVVVEGHELEQVPLAEVPEQEPVEEQKQPTPAPAAPVGVPETPKAPVQDEPWYTHLTNKSIDQKLVNKAPDWYNFDAPPEITGNEQAIMSIVAGLIQAGLAPDKKSAIAMALGGAADAVNAKLAAPGQDYQNRLKAAQGQASMAATLNRGSGSELGALNYGLAERKFKNQLEKEAEERRIKEAENRLDSPETKYLQDVVIKNGTFPEDVARTMTGAQIRFGRVGGQQLAGFERTSGENLTKFNRGQTAKKEWHDIERSDKMEDRALDRDEKLADRDLNDQEKNEQAYIPGFAFAGKRAPNIASVEKARVVSDNTAVASEAADQLIDIWKKMSNRARLTPNWLEGTLSQEDLDLVNDARNWGLQLDTAQRNLANMGVPQQFEMEIVKSVNPDANGIRAFLNDGAAWRAQQRTLNKIAERRMRAYGYVPEGSAPQQAPAPQGPSRTLPQKIKEAGEATGETVNQAIDAGKQVVSGAVDTAGKVMKAAGPAGQLLKVQVLDPVTKQWGAAREVTEDQYRKAMKTLADKGLGPAYIRKAP